MNPMNQAEAFPDAIDRAAGLRPGAPLHALRRARPAFVEGAEICRRAVLTPADDQGLGTDMRLVLARRMASQNHDAALVAEYDGLLSALPLSPALAALAAGGAGEGARDAAIARHCDLVTLVPARAGAADLGALAAAGLSLPQVVALSELIAFVNFQTRVAEGLRLLARAGDVTPAPTGAERLPVLPAVKLKALTWVPHIPPVEIAEATPAQLEAMKVTPSATKVSPYVRTLAHDPESYVARTVLFNAIMHDKGGLPFPDREIGALGASVVNGCRYCAVVHARRHAQLTGSDHTVSAVYLGRPEALGAHDAALFDFARALSVTPSQATVAQVERLLREGLDPAGIIDLIHAIAIFGWANRLMHPLGHARA